MTDVTFAGQAHGGVEGGDTVSFNVTPLVTPSAAGIGVAWNDDSVFVLSVKYAGVSCGAAQMERNSTDHGKVAIYGIVNPLDGVQPVEIVFTSPVGSSICGVILAANSSTTTVFGHVQGTTGNGADLVAAVPLNATSEELAFDVVVSLAGGTLSTGGFSLAWHTTSEGIVMTAVKSLAPHASPLNFAHDIGNPDAPWAIVAASFLSADAAPPSADGGPIGPLLLTKDANGHDMYQHPMVAGHKYAIALSAGVENTFFIPSASDGNVGTGDPVRVIVTADSYTWAALGATLSVPGANVVNGTGPILIAPKVPKVLVIPAGAIQMSLISTAGGLACCEWYDH